MMHTCVRRGVLFFVLIFSSLIFMAVPAQAALSASPNSVDFGSQLVGANGQSIPVTLTNHTRRTFSIVAISTSTAEFSVSVPSLPTTLTPGQSLTVGVTFGPDDTTSFSGSMSFTTYYGWTLSVPLSGLGVSASDPQPAPGAALSSGQLSFNSILSFGTIAVGASGSQTFTLANTGGSDVTISDISFAGQSLTLSGISAGAVIAAGASIPVSATFSPVAAGASSGLITFSSDAANSPATISWTAAAPQTADAVVHSVNLSWSASSSNGVTGYNVYRSAISGGPYNLVTTSPVAATDFIDGSVSPAQTFYYVVTSIGADNTESGYSDEVSAAVT